MSDGEPEITAGQIDDLNMKIQTLCAGLPTKVAIIAVADCLAGILGFAATDLEHAHGLVDKVSVDMKAAITRNWPTILEARAAADRMQPPAPRRQ